MFNINKYRGVKFHDNEAINKKVEALFLLYDKKVDDGKLNYKGQIRLLNVFIDDLIRFEEYEVVDFFKERKLIKYKKWRAYRRDYKIPFRLRMRLMRFRVSKFFRNIF